MRQVRLPLVTPCIFQTASYFYRIVLYTIVRSVVD